MQCSVPCTHLMEWSLLSWAGAGDGGSPASEGGSYIGRHGGNHPATVSTQSLPAHAALNMLHSPQCCTLHTTCCIVHIVLHFALNVLNSPCWHTLHTTCCTVRSVALCTQHVAHFMVLHSIFNMSCCTVSVAHATLNMLHSLQLTLCTKLVA